ncbi:MAG: pyridoxamine 5'-phosphate oxidase family protein [Acidobacteriota bacterium]
MAAEIDKLYALIEHIEIAMMTTKRSDGHLRARPMANQKQAPGADLWFVTSEGTAKLADLALDGHVNLTYLDSGSMEWVSVSGTAAVSRDRATIAALYAPDWKMWFGDDGDPRHGTVDDPRIVLIGVTVDGAEFLQVNKPKPAVIYELVKGWLTGTEPEIGEAHAVAEAPRPPSR